MTTKNATTTAAKRTSKKKTLKDAAEVVANAQAEAQVQEAEANENGGDATDQAPAAEAAPEAAAPQARADSNPPRRGGYQRTKSFIRRRKFNQGENSVNEFDSVKQEEAANMVSFACGLLTDRDVDLQWEAGFVLLVHASRVLRGDDHKRARDAAMEYSHKEIQRRLGSGDQNAEHIHTLAQKLCRSYGKRPYTVPPIWVNEYGMLERSSETAERLIREVLTSRVEEIRVNWEKRVVDFLDKTKLVSAERAAEIVIREVLTSRVPDWKETIEKFLKNTKLVSAEQADEIYWRIQDELDAKKSGTAEDSADEEGGEEDADESAPAAKA